MQPKNFCQSCSMPIDDTTLRGTEKDGSLSSDYCKYCYVNGAFINPGMTLDEMRTLVKDQLAKMHSPDAVVKMAVDSLPHLKRWREKSPIV